MSVIAATITCTKRQKLNKSERQRAFVTIIKLTCGVFAALLLPHCCRRGGPAPDLAPPKPAQPTITEPAVGMGIAVGTAMEPAAGIITEPPCTTEVVGAA